MKNKYKKVKVQDLKLKGGIILLTNYGEETYYRDNNLPINIFSAPSSTTLNTQIKKDKVLLRIEFYDSFVCDDGLHMTVHEDFQYKTIVLTGEEFYKLVVLGDGLEILWNKMGVEEFYGEEILDDTPEFVQEFHNMVENLSPTIESAKVIEKLEFNNI